MTSPAQLKYLEAMGIPVWVSRELIVEDKPIALENKLEKPKSNSAKSLIDSLNAPQAPRHQTQEPKPQEHVVKHAENIRTPVESVINRPEEKREQTEQRASNRIGHTPYHEIFGCGNLSADWMVIGQSPDTNESKLNQPYPYESGELLTNMLRAVGLKQPRQDAYLINILQSSLHNKEADILSANIDLNKLLIAKIQEIQPKLLLIVGQLAAQIIFNSKEPLARLRAQQYKQSVTINAELNTPVIVTYYPAYLLSKPQDKAKVWNDLKLAMKQLPNDDK